MGRDLYAEDEKLVLDLKKKMVSDIITILKEKGYSENNVAVGDKYRFELAYDTVLLNNTHPDWVKVDSLLEAVRDAYHVLPTV